MVSQANLRVIIADDHPVVLAGLVALLRQINKLQVVAACSEGKSALKEILEMQPDIACLDIMMPGLTGIEIVQAARRAGSITQFVFLTGSASRDEFAAALECGVAAIFHKDSASDELLEWFEACQFQHGKMAAGPQSDEGGRARNLTAREREIAMLTARGLSNKHIARAANISEGTVKIHLYNIYQKLGISNRTELANYASLLSILGS
jgi:two-component system nitrate/nitrite response regulator NarL